MVMTDSEAKCLGCGCFSGKIKQANPFTDEHGTVHNDWFHTSERGCVDALTAKNESLTAQIKQLELNSTYCVSCGVTEVRAVDEIALLTAEIEMLRRDNHKWREHSLENMQDADQLAAKLIITKRALALHHSMVLGGEEESVESEKIFREAMGQNLACRPDGGRDGSGMLMG